MVEDDNIVFSFGRELISGVVEFFYVYEGI